MGVATQHYECIHTLTGGVEKEVKNPAQVDMFSGQADCTILVQKIFCECAIGKKFLFNPVLR
jgi:hypothetical protein